MNFFIIGNQGGSCDDYFVLNDPTRNSEYLGIDYCDRLDCYSKSPGWQGAAWYRMAEPAGTTIPEEPVDVYHCNTNYPGWLNGHHPATAGETINGKVCFIWHNGNTCYYETQIQIKHCTSYYLYYLVEPPYCNFRYCSTSTTLIGNVKTNRTEILQYLDSTSCYA